MGYDIAQAPGEDGLTRGPAAVAGPRIRPAGPVDYAMYDSFRDQLDAAPARGRVVVELSTWTAIPRSPA